jgi:peptidoglycan/LPS O-acetylase OafA/YrhL
VGALDERVGSQPAVRMPRLRFALSVLAIAGAVALAVTPFRSASHQKGRERSIQCGSPVTAFLASDPAPTVAAVVSQGQAHSAVAPPTRENVRHLAAMVASADRYHACHRAATRRLAIAAFIALVGLWTPGRWWYRLAPRSVERTAGNEFLKSFGYHPALDGVRAISILMVLARHLNLHGVFVSGDHGVDIFFVLSGFLITTLLLREHDASGRISLRHFYVRRALRLYPVVVVVLVIGATVRLLDPAFLGAPAWSGLVATTFYYANWMHGWNPQGQGFLSHTWSLSIEEQFYLFWPPVVAALLARGRGRLALGLVAAAGAVAGAVYRASIWQHTLDSSVPATRLTRSVVEFHRIKGFDHWYFSSFAHADTLLVGCLLAIVLTPSVIAAVRARSGLVVGLAWLAALTIGYLCLRETVLGTGMEVGLGERLVKADFVPIWGLPVFEVCVAVVLLALVTVPTGVMSSMLSQRTLTWIGRRSYGLYVLHLPIFELVAHTNLAQGYPLMALQLIAAFATAALSFHFIEAPALALKRRFTGAITRPGRQPAHD